MNRVEFPMTRTCPFAPPPRTEELRDNRQVPRVRLWNGTRPWLFTRFDDCRVVLSHPAFSADKGRPGYPLSSAVAAAEVLGAPTLLIMDNPEHDATRRLVQTEFTVRRGERWRPVVRAAVDTAIDGLLAGPRPGDLVASVALPVALSFVCELLGVPYADREFFRSRTHTANDVTLGTAEAAAARRELEVYLTDLVRARAVAPGDDFISRAAARITEPRVLAGMALLLVTAGHDTTANMIALGVLTLLRHPDQFARLRGEPADAAVEELLRHLTIVQRGIRRIARTDVEVNGHLVRAGEGVIAAISAANRDPDWFPDGGRFDIDRRARAHLAFGYGNHQCLGQALARVELQETYSAIARRLPGLRLAVPVEQIAFKHDMAVYGVHALPVEW